jgi:NAD(P)-dependent dehydrogenase (short-subunit alcohol dehydrogenase family)
MTVTRAILVTGAASGIGAAICARLAERGVGLLIHTRGNAEGVARVAEQARAAGAEAEIALGDLSDPATAGRLVAGILDRFGRLDVLVSNAGFADRARIAQLTDLQFAASQEAIAGAFFRLGRAASPHLSQGRVIAVSSFVAHGFRTDLPIFAASAAAKAALEALVKALALELAPTGTTVNAVSPGFIRKDKAAPAALAPGALVQQTAKIPLGRVGEPADVAASVGFLASREAGYITGQVLNVDGGLII